MNTRVLFLLLLCLFGAAIPTTQALTTLNQALSASLNVLITSGQYAEIFNKWLSVGTYAVPTCSGASFPAPTGSLLTVLRSKQIIFGATAQVFPFTFAADADGQIRAGASYDLAVAIAGVLSYQYGVVVVGKVVNDPAPNGFADLSRDLQLGLFDALISYTTVTQQRVQVVDFTCPWFRVSLGILQSNVSTPVTTVSALNSNQYSIGYILGTTGQYFVTTQLNNVSYNNQVPFATRALLYAAATGPNPTVNVAIDDKPLEQYFASISPSALPVVPNVNIGLIQPIAIATRKGSAATVAISAAAVVFSALAIFVSLF